VLGDLPPALSQLLLIEKRGKIDENWGNKIEPTVAEAFTP
jgi:hypothetical protein